MSDSDDGVTPPSRDIVPVTIEDELRKSYLDYAMSVIVGRALPDVRDGLKPVHRRVLYAMSELNNTWNRPYRKSATVVGEVMGKYHPHGDSAIYETVVRLAQPWSMRYPLVDGQGNFGSIDPDPPAAMRYTEVRMARLAGEMLADLDKETVDVVNNYDDTLTIPEVLPTRLPNLLVNGSAGIAVGMATNVPPHNLNEIVAALLALLDDPTLSVDDLMQHVTGPDFPTGGIINGRAGIVQAYRTGRGRIYVRAKAHVEVAANGREKIVVTELPYQVGLRGLMEKIAELVKDKRIQGISELRDESDKDGLRVVIEIRRGDSGEVVLNNLYQQTRLQSVFGINCVALVRGQPKVVNLKDMLELFLAHRREVVTRRTVYLLRRARERGHVLEGQAVALSNIDPVIELIKASAGTAEARVALTGRGWPPGHVSEMLSRAGSDACRPQGLDAAFGLRDDGLYYLTGEQAQAILNMQLHRLTSMEQEKLLEEYKDILDQIADYQEILSSHERLLNVIRGELGELLEQYGDERRTEIRESQADLTLEDLITEEDVVVTLSHQGYAKRQSLSEYRAQRRGGVGKAATAVKDEDFIERLLVASTHDTLMLFTSRGKVYWLRTFEIPQGTRNSRGRPIVNLLPLAEDERITTILPSRELRDDSFIFFATANGTVKKTEVAAFTRQRSVGLIALDLEEDNTLVGVAVTSGRSDVLLVASNGKATRFKESDVRAMGRTARGVRGIRLTGGHRVISLIVPQENGFVLTASEAGYGKRTPVTEFPVKGRGAKGVIAMAVSKRNGNTVGAVQVFAGDEIMLISDQGTLVRTRADEVSVLGRNTQGVKLINLREGERLVGLERIVEGEQDDGDAATDAAGSTATAGTPEPEADAGSGSDSPDTADTPDSGDF